MAIYRDEITVVVFLCEIKTSLFILDLTLKNGRRKRTILCVLATGSLLAVAPVLHYTFQVFMDLIKTIISTDSHSVIRCGKRTLSNFVGKEQILIKFSPGHAGKEQHLVVSCGKRTK